MTQYANVIVDLSAGALDRLFSYRVPEGMPIVPGQQVRIPFGPRRIEGFVASLSAPLLNTVFFMGYIVLAFYQTEYVQGLVAAKGATNPLMFIVLLVGVQGLIEAVVCSVAGTAVARGIHKALGGRKH